MSRGEPRGHRNKGGLTCRSVRNFHNRRGARRPARSLWRGHDLRHSRRAQRRNVPGPAAFRHQARFWCATSRVRDSWPTVMRGRPASRASASPSRAWDAQHSDAAGPGLSDSSNVLVISSALDLMDAAQGRGRLHEMIDQRGAAAAVTSLHMRAYTPKDVARCGGASLRQFCQPAAASGLHRNPA